MAQKTAKFNIGDWVRHSRQNYRAVIVDVDPIFQASGQFNPQALVRDFATRNPWYRLLVDGCSQITYVEECLLLPDVYGGVVDNPNVTLYLKQQNGHYFASWRCH
jgi:heat shock protein HspQ